MAEEPAEEPAAELEPVPVDEYTLLQQKIKKVDNLLQNMLLKHKENTKEYRAYERKKQGYMKLLMKTTEYKTKKLQDALSDLKASMHSVSTSDSVSVDSLSLDGSESGSESDAESEDSGVDYDVVLKKHDKCERILKELRDEHGEEEAPLRMDYKKFEKKMKSYVKELATTDEWATEKSEREEARVKDAIYEETHSKALLAAKESHAAELAEAKEKVLLKLRKQRSSMEEQKKLTDMAYDQENKAANEAAFKESSEMAEMMASRTSEYKKLVDEQVDLGLISADGDE
jgi:uncharacterized protein (DUF2132 family)